MADPQPASGARFEQFVEIERTCIVQLLEAGHTLVDVDRANRDMLDQALANGAAPEFAALMAQAHAMAVHQVRRRQQQ